MRSRPSVEVRPRQQELANFFADPVFPIVWRYAIVELGNRAVSAGVMTALLLGGLALAGCDDNVEVLRDPSVRITRGMTWAWRPNAPVPVSSSRAGDGNGRKVVSRDVITPAPQQHMESNRDWNNEANRKILQEAIERGLSERGLVQGSDPAMADLLVDYHVAVKQQRATVGTVYPSGWGWGWWGPPEVEYQTARWHEGTFVLDLALRSPRTLAYRAIGHRELNNKSAITPYQADSAVNHLLKGLKLK